MLKFGILVELGTLIKEEIQWPKLSFLRDLKWKGENYRLNQHQWKYDSEMLNFGMLVKFGTYQHFRVLLRILECWNLAYWLSLAQIIKEEIQRPKLSFLRDLKWRDEIYRLNQHQWKYDSGMLLVKFGTYQHFRVLLLFLECWNLAYW